MDFIKLKEKSYKCKKTYLPTIIQNLATGYKNNCIFEGNKESKGRISDILTKTINIAEDSLAPNLKYLLEVIVIQLKDNDSDINRIGEKFNSLVQSVIKNQPSMVT